jgi:putative oxidoreductase
VVLVDPEIPQNTGNIARLCAATASRLTGAMTYAPGRPASFTVSFETRSGEWALTDRPIRLATTLGVPIAVLGIVITMASINGPIETIGGALLIVGLFTRPTAFILCGEMAVAYFHSWFSMSARGFLPIINGGEESTMSCFFFLWLVTVGGGAWSLDALIAKHKKAGADLAVAAGEPVRT